MLGFCRKNETCGYFSTNSSNFASTRPSKASIKIIKVLKLLEHFTVAALNSKVAKSSLL